ncbi:MAG: hypothetical protein GXP34_09935 [Actinobacteria bacterium]|nr:hypothetical protein [Actinomycetota bacterium]
MMFSSPGPDGRNPVEEQPELPEHVNALFDDSIGQVEAELAWIEDMTSRLQGGSHGED